MKKILLLITILIAQNAHSQECDPSFENKFYNQISISEEERFLKEMYKAEAEFRKNLNDELISELYDSQSKLNDKDKQIKRLKRQLRRK